MTHLQKITETLTDFLGVSPEAIKPEATLQEDLGCDSLDTVELMMVFEEEYDINIDDADAEACKTVADVLALLDRLHPSGV